MTDKGIVYKYTFINDVVYVGSTKSGSIDRRAGKNGKNNYNMNVKEMIDKYGWGNVKKEIIYQNLSIKEMYIKEREEILKLADSGQRTYNRNVPLEDGTHDSNSYGLNMPCSTFVGSIDRWSKDHELYYEEMSQEKIDLIVDFKIKLFKEDEEYDKEFPIRSIKNTHYTIMRLKKMATEITDNISDGEYTSKFVNILNGDNLKKVKNNLEYYEKLHSALIKNFK